MCAARGGAVPEEPAGGEGAAATGAVSARGRRAPSGVGAEEEEEGEGWAAAGGGARRGLPAAGEPRPRERGRGRRGAGRGEAAPRLAAGGGGARGPRGWRLPPSEGGRRHLAGRKGPGERPGGW